MVPNTGLRTDPTHSEDELREMLRKMRNLSDLFYNQVTSIGCHPFIEFTGFMNEYIRICEIALTNGIDFTDTSIHSSGPVLPMQDFHAAYIGEKFGCIFGRTMSQNPKILEAFQRSAFGVEALQKKAQNAATSKGDSAAPRQPARRGGKAPATAGKPQHSSCADDRVLSRGNRAVKSGSARAKGSAKR